MASEPLLHLVAEPLFAAGLHALHHRVLLVDSAVLTGVLRQLVVLVIPELCLLLFSLVNRGRVREVVDVLL